MEKRTFVDIGGVYIREGKTQAQVIAQMEDIRTRAIELGYGPHGLDSHSSAQYHRALYKPFSITGPSNQTDLEIAYEPYINYKVRTAPGSGILLSEDRKATYVASSPESVYTRLPATLSTSENDRIIEEATQEALMLFPSESLDSLLDIKEQLDENLNLCQYDLLYSPSPQIKAAAIRTSIRTDRMLSILDGVLIQKEAEEMRPVWESTKDSLSPFPEDIPLVLIAKGRLGTKFLYDNDAIEMVKATRNFAPHDVDYAILDEYSSEILDDLIQDGKVYKMEIAYQPTPQQTMSPGFSR